MAKNITRLKDNWLVYMLLLIFVVLTYGYELGFYELYV